MRTKAVLIASAALVARAAGACAAGRAATAGCRRRPSPVQNARRSATRIAVWRVAGQVGADETAVEEVSAANPSAAASLPPSPPVEYPGWARRDPWIVGGLDPAVLGLGDAPWGAASGAFLSTLMRRMDTPLASRWAHIALRDALLAKVRGAARTSTRSTGSPSAPGCCCGMGEADAARMLVAGVDADRFTPKMVQVGGAKRARQLPTRPALCPLEDGIRKYDPGIRPLVQAMCAALAGEPDKRSAMIDQARRYGRIGGIDLALAEKVVGAGAESAAPRPSNGIRSIALTGLAVRLVDRRPACFRRTG